MEIQVMIPSPSSSKLDFNFDSTTTSPYISAPSSPQQRFNNNAAFYYSAPTSPSRASAFYHDDEEDDITATSSSVPFDWEEKPGLPKSSASSNYGDAEEEDINNSDNDFAFDFSGQFETASLHADELFDGGKIKPLKPPPRFEFNNSFNKPPPESPRSPKKMIQEAFRKKKDYDFDPFQAALEIQTRKEKSVTANTSRGRSENKAHHAKPSHHRRKSTGTARSLSPFRVSDLLLDPEEKVGDSNASSTSSMFSLFWYKKWKIKDLLLFRSASESRASDSDDQLKKYAALRSKAPSGVDRDAKNSSFRSTDGGSVGSVSSRRRTGGPPISAHELHYNMSRAVSEEMKKRTFLPYKQGLLGCLGFNPSVPIMSRNRI